MTIEEIRRKMKTEEIRQKAIRCSRKAVVQCRKSTCNLGKCDMYDLCFDSHLEGASSTGVVCYEQGFADGARDFAEWVLRSPKIWQEDYMLLADVETLIHDYEKQTKGEG